MIARRHPAPQPGLGVFGASAGPMVPAPPRRPLDLQRSRVRTRWPPRCPRMKAENPGYW